AVPGDEVPAAPQVDKAVGLDQAAALREIAASIREPKALGIATGRGDRRQVLRIDGRAAHGERGRRRSERADATPEVYREDLLELDQRPHGGLLDSGHRRAGSGPKAHRDRDRLVVVEEQWRHRGAGP